MGLIHWHRYQMDSKTCYEGRVNGEIWYDLTVHKWNNFISMTYVRYAGLAQNDIPVYYKFENTNDVRSVKKICETDANSEDSRILLQYKDVAFYDLSERSSKLIADTDELIKKIRASNQK